jgi:hypothetical protein
VRDCFALFGEDRIRIPNVWTGGVLQGETLSAGTFGLAPMYQTYLWSVWNAPGHHGYERAFD